MNVHGSHLTYCLNVHPGESLADVWRAVEGPAYSVKQELSPNAPFGLGLRVADTALRQFEQPGQTERFRQRLDALGMYVFTLNGFPYGAFHATSVKDRVYRPDWSHPERARYTAGLCRLLAAWLPQGGYGSVSTVPLGFRADGQQPSRVEGMARALLEQVCQLAKLESETGNRVCVALEPEPGCLLETTLDVVAFFQSHLYSRTALERVARSCGVAPQVAQELVARHLGVCLDTCHLAVEFESAAESLDHLRRAGVVLAKVQLSSGLRVFPSTPGAIEALRRYDEPVYLHQVVIDDGGGRLVRFNDLPDAFLELDRYRDCEWRVHFHVPVHVERYAHFDSTRPFIEELLRLHREQPVCSHLEVETYTWDVLPERPSSLEASLVKELSWVMGQLTG